MPKGVLDEAQPEAILSSLTGQAEEASYRELDWIVERKESVASERSLVLLKLLYLRHVGVLPSSHYQPTAKLVSVLCGMPEERAIAALDRAVKEGALERVKREEL